jgi:hypothetical protein
MWINLGVLACQRTLFFRWHGENFRERIQQIPNAKMTNLSSVKICAIVAVCVAVHPQPIACATGFPVCVGTSASAAIVMRDGF